VVNPAFKASGDSELIVKSGDLPIGAAYQVWACN